MGISILDNESISDANKEINNNNNKISSKKMMEKQNCNRYVCFTYMNLSSFFFANRKLNYSVSMDLYAKVKLNEKTIHHSCVKIWNVNTWNRLQKLYSFFQSEILRFFSFSQNEIKKKSEKIAILPIFSYRALWKVRKISCLQLNSLIVHFEIH